MHHDRTFNRKAFLTPIEEGQGGYDVKIMDPTSLPSGKVSRSTSRSPEIKVGTRLRWTGCDCPSYDKGGIYSVVEVHPAMWVVEGDMQRNYESSMSCWEIVDEPKQEKPKKVPVRRGGVTGPRGGPVEMWLGSKEINSTSFASFADPDGLFGMPAFKVNGADFDHIRVPESFTGPLPEWCEWEKGSEPKPDGYRGCVNCASKRADMNMCCSAHARWMYEKSRPICPDWVPEPPF